MPDDAAASAPPEALAALRGTWHYDAFRPGQAEAVAAVLAGRDALAVLPTGGGKSLTYQVPAVVAAPRRAVVLVVSPLIALMRDQVDALARRGVPAAMAHAGMSPRDEDQLWTDAEFGRYRLVYVTPERLQTDLFRARAPRLPVALLAVDEAHCVSRVGPRLPPGLPAHRRGAPAPARRRRAPTPVLAVTATATPDVRRDIVEQLDLRDPALIVRGFDRPNLMWSVTHTQDRERRAADLLREAGGAALVYAGTRKATEAWAARLVAGGPARRGVPRRPATGRARRRAGALDRWRDADSRRDERLRHGHRQARRARGRPCRPPADARGVLPGGRPRGTRRPAVRAALLVAPDDDRAPRRMAETGHPLAPEVQAVYAAAGSLAQLAIGWEPDGPITLDAGRLAAVAGLPPPTVRAAVERLAQAGVWSVSEATRRSRPRTRRAVRAAPLARDAAPAVAAFVGAVLRVLPAEAFSGWSSLPIDALVKRSDLPEARVRAGLAFLAERRLVEVQPAGAGSLRVTWTGPRTERVPLDALGLERARARALARLDEVEAYATGVGCRRQHLLAHFGEPAPPRCGHCDVCLGALRPATVTPADEPLLLALLVHIGQGDEPDAWLAGTPTARRDGLLDWLAQNGFVRLEDPLARVWTLTPKGQRRAERQR